MTSAYLESRILSADPIELIQILYEGVLHAVEEARRNLRCGDIAARSKAIGRAVEILSELSCSLNHNAGGEISRGLAELYDYMQRRLLEANFHQADPPLAEVSRLLTTVSEGWRGVRSEAADQRPAGESDYAAESAGPAMAGRYMPETSGGHGCQAWTL